MPLMLREVPLADRTVQRSRRRSRTRRLRSTQSVGRKSRRRSRSSRGAHSPARSSHRTRSSAVRIFREQQVRLRSPSLLPITRSKRCTSPKRHRRSPGHSKTLRKKADREAQKLISKLHACRRWTELSAREALAARSQVQDHKLRRDWRDPDGDDWSRELRAFSPERREEQAKRRAMAEEYLARLKVKEEELEEDTDKVGVIVCGSSVMGARGLATSSATAQTVAEEEEEVPRVGRHGSRVRSPKAASTSTATSSTSSRKLRQNSLFRDYRLDKKKFPLHSKFRTGISIDSKPSSDVAQEVTTTRSEEEIEKICEQEDPEREIQEDGVEQRRQEEKTMVQKEQARREEHYQADELLADVLRSFRAPVTVSERETGVGAVICTLPEGDNMSIEEDDSEESSLLQRLPFKPAVTPAAGAISMKPPASMFRDDSVEGLVSEQPAYTPTPVATVAGEASTARHDHGVAPPAQQKLLSAMFQDDSDAISEPEQPAAVPALAPASAALAPQRPLGHMLQDDSEKPSAGGSLAQLVSPAGDADSAVKFSSAMFNGDSHVALATPSTSQPQPFQEFSDKASSKGSRGSWQLSNSDKDWDNMELSEVEELLGSSDPTVPVPQACDTASSSLEDLRRNPPSEVARLLEVVQAFTNEVECVTFKAREYWVHGAWHLEKLREDAEALKLLKELQTDATGLTLKLSAEDYWEDGQWDLESLREDVRWKSSLQYDDVGGNARDTQQLRDERPEEQGILNWITRF